VLVQLFGVRLMTARQTKADTLTLGA